MPPPPPLLLLLAWSFSAFLDASLKEMFRPTMLGELSMLEKEPGPPTLDVMLSGRLLPMPGRSSNVVSGLRSSAMRSKDVLMLRCRRWSVGRSGTRLPHWWQVVHCGRAAVSAGGLGNCAVLAAAAARFPVGMAVV